MGVIFSEDLDNLQADIIRKFREAEERFRNLEAIAKELNDRILVLEPSSPRDVVLLKAHNALVERVAALEAWRNSVRCAPSNEELERASQYAWPAEPQPAASEKWTGYVEKGNPLAHLGVTGLPQAVESMPQPAPPKERRWTLHPDEGKICHHPQDYLYSCGLGYGPAVNVIELTPAVQAALELRERIEAEIDGMRGDAHIGVGEIRTILIAPAKGKS